MGVELLEVRVRCGTTFSGVSYIHCSSGRQDGGVGAKVLWLCMLLSECPDSLRAVPVLCPLVTGVEVASAGQVELWLNGAGLDVRGSMLEATLRGRPLG